MISPQEMAKDLVSTFYHSLPNNGYLEDGINSCGSRWKESVSCALISVDKIMQELQINDNINRYNYYLDVENEIKKL